MNKNDIRNNVINELNLEIYENSIFIKNDEIYFVKGPPKEKALVKLSPIKYQNVNNLDGIENDLEIDKKPYKMKICPLNHKNAFEMQRLFPNLLPKPLGLKSVIGLGDRLGIATPGHIKAVKESSLNPVFAQQSIREMKRTERTPQQVLDDAFWGVFISGWERDWGADADHLKDKESIQACINAGYTMFTIDVGDFVDNKAYSYTKSGISKKIKDFPWGKIEDNLTNFIDRYVDNRIIIDGKTLIQVDKELLFPAFIKYGYAIIQAVDLFRYVVDKKGIDSFDFEVSIDETDIPTTPFEHYLIVKELSRLGVRITSIAPRFVGKFEKGVDYIGDINKFASELKKHFQIMSLLGPYKIGLHSGSDKFRIYPTASDILGQYFHLKTSGTSYLEALKVIAECDLELLKEISKFCIIKYQEDRKSYFVSADVNRFPNFDNIRKNDIDEIFENLHFRQIMHVTYGSVLSEKKSDNTYKFKPRIYQILLENEDRYFEYLYKHIKRHITPFISGNA